MVEETTDYWFGVDSAAVRWPIGVLLQSTYVVALPCTSTDLPCDGHSLKFAHIQNKDIAQHTSLLTPTIDHCCDYLSIMFYALPFCCLFLFCRRHFAQFDGYVNLIFLDICCLGNMGFGTMIVGISSFCLKTFQRVNS